MRADRLALFLPAGAEAVGLFFGTSASWRSTCVQAFFRGAIVFALQGGLLDLERGGLALDLVDLGGDGADLDGERGGGFVDQVDGLVGQEAVGDVAVRERGRGDDRRILDADLVMRLVALA